MKLNSFPRWLALAFGLAMAAVLAGGGSFYHNERQHAWQHAEAELQTIARFKADQLAQWRAERLADASQIMESAYLNEGIATWLATNSPAETEKLLNRFRSTARQKQYRDVLLVDANGQVLLSLTGRGGRLHEEVVQTLATAVRQRRAVLTNLHRGDGDLRIHLDVVAPIFAVGAETGEPLGAIILQCDAEQYLYPLIQSWPVPSASGETVFFSRDGDDVLFLSELRFQKDAALNLRVPLTHREVPAVMAVLGKTGIMEGTDYRGVEVLSFLQAVPDSPWFLVAKQDSVEVFAPLRQEALAAAAVVALLIVTLALVFGFMWYQRVAAQKVRLLNESLEQRVRARTAELQESQARFRELAESLPQLVWTCRGDGPCDYLSPQWVAYTGIPEAEQLGFRWLDQLHSEDRARTVAVWNEAVAANKPFDIEFRIRRQDGVYRWFKTRAVAMRDSDNRIVKWFGTSTDVDDQKRAEERFRIAAISLSDVIYEWDLGERIDWFGDVDGLMGYAPGEFPRTMAGWGTTLHPEDRERVMAAVANHLQGEAPYNVEYRLRKKDGVWAWWTARGTALRDADGKPIRWIGAITDITERKRTEEALHSSGERMEAVMDGMDALVYVADFGTHELLFLNKFGRKSFGDPAPGTKCYEFLQVGQTSPCPFCTNDRLLDAAGEPTGIQRWEFQNTKTGAWFDCRDQAIRWTDGLLVRLEIAIEITARKQAEEELRRHRDHLEQLVRERTVQVQDQAHEQAIILDSIPALVFYKDRDNRILRVNQDFADAMGLTREQMEGKSCLELWPAQGEEYWKADQEVMASETAKRGIIEPLQTTGGARWLRTDKVPFRDEKGVITGIIGFSIDITERKLAEERILKLNEDLARRTSELEAVNHELEAFSYSVSHDLKAPLRSVDGFAQMLEEDYGNRLDDEGRRLLKVVRDSARDMGQLVNDLLTFSRLSRKDLIVARLDMRRMAEDARRQVEPSAAGRTIRWEIGDLPSAYGDEATIREVLLNLFANAVKFTRPRQQAVIGFAGRAEAGEVVYTVTDNGVGFDMTYKAKLFSVFQRLHTSDEFEGTGIGLALVQRIIQRHGGRVWAEGEVDKGARFYFTLPMEGTNAEVGTRNAE